jgi:molybdopterin converting factor small subunit
MQVNIILFGQLTDIIGTDSLTMENIQDTEMLEQTLHATYPALLHATFVMAVDKKIVSANTLLTDQCTVALLPPFSGG